MTLLRKIPLIQGIYYLLTGIWPLLHIESFMEVTGPKTDLWLVKTVGVLVIVIGIVQVTCWKRLSPELKILSIASAIGFMIIDIYFVLADVISGIYLLDAFIQADLLLCWILLIWKTSHLRRSKTNEHLPG